MLTDIIKTTFARLNKDGVPATPDMYRRYFCEEARKIGLFNSECNSIDALAESLSYKNKRKLKKLDIESMDQLLDFLIAQLEGPGDTSDEKEDSSKSIPVKNKNLESLVGLVEIIKTALHPSVGNLYSEEIDDINEKIATHPELLSDKGTQETLHKLSRGRVSFDRRSIINQTIELTDIASDISKSLNKSIEINKIGSNKITQAKSQLNGFEKVDFTNKKQTSVLKNHFISISETIETEAKQLNTNLDKENKFIKVMSKKISVIKNDIENVDDKSNTDFLTGTYTKYGFREVLKEIEAKYYGSNEDYCLVLYDLDKIDKINKVYGFDAGDRVISVFAHLLKKEFNENGAVSRYGGNKFLLAIYDIDLDTGIKHANAILDVLHTVQFTYREEKMKVTLSGAVCSRSNNKSQDLMVTNLHDLLQRAKSNGRNRIEICPSRNKQSL